MNRTYTPDLAPDVLSRLDAYAARFRDAFDRLWLEYEARGIGPGIIDEQEYDAKPYRVFFAKDPYGVCFCFTHPLGPEGDA